MGRWLSQQPGEQNTSLTRPELQVLTEHLISLLPTVIGLRHMEHTNAGEVAMALTVIAPVGWRKTERRPESSRRVGERR